ncbi:hypothetical protein G6O69_35555 [Pseudenhygromyxa sp. WMMC2535]|uniref:hypothetical protein n=1 Tax=Pseudenhygromyxa sp. WMMC2535 TaxID=2712867 RepID=UPI001553DAE9|nr:hypothetical protein [Pseudenhygromyxa sp. WMMC2535]NVB43195.1 hypothetical protein [Pseudenhygromyxa sp. WMMC2535]
MKKFRTLLALAALAPMLAACAPAPEKVCGHVIELMKKEFGEQAGEISEEDTKKMLENCVKDAEKEKEMKGSIEYNKQAKCVMAADSLEALGKCEEKEGDKKE